MRIIDQLGLLPSKEMRKISEAHMHREIYPREESKAVPILFLRHQCSCRKPSSEASTPKRRLIIATVK
jgi:hypothetical protein